MAGGGNDRGSLHLATLVIASAASATAAIATSRVWGPGTFITAALTPVIVAFVTEALRRPSDKVAERVSVVRETRAGGPAPPTVPETSSEARLDERAGRAYEREVGRAPETRPPEPGRPYRTYAEPPSRRLPVAIAVTTGLLAFLVAAAALTLPELLAGDSVTGRDRTTLFGGESDGERRQREQTEPAPAPTQSQPTRTVTTPEQPKTDTGKTKTQTTTQPKTTPTTTQPQTETAP